MVKKYGNQKCRAMKILQIGWFKMDWPIMGEGGTVAPNRGIFEKSMLQEKFIFWPTEAPKFIASLSLKQFGS